MQLGYARVSTDDQDLRLQRAALREAGAGGCTRKKCSVLDATGLS